MANKEATLLLRIKEAGSEALDKVGSAFGSIKEIAMVTFTAISAVVVKAIAEYRQQEEATNALNRAMVNQGVYSRDLAKAYQEQADAIAKKTLFEGEDITKSQAVLQGYLGQTKVTKELTMAVADLAQAKGIDLASAAEMVGKSIGTSTNALARNGIEVNTNASKQEKLEQVVSAVNKQFGGQAEAATEGLGVLGMLQKIFNDLMQTVGERLVPVILLFANKLKNLSQDTQTVTGLMDAFIGTIKVLTQVGTVLGGIFEAVGKIIGVHLGAAIESVTAIMEGDFARAGRAATLATQMSGEAIVEAYKNTKQTLGEIDEAFAVKKQENLAKEEQMEKDSLQRRGTVRREEMNKQALQAIEDKIAQQEIDMSVITASEDQKGLAQINAQIKTQENLLKNATTSQAKLAAQNEIFRLNELKREELVDQMRIKARGDTLNTISSLTNSNNKALAMAGKAAGITQIAIDTPVAISKALSAFPPPFNFAAAGLVGAAMAAQAAQIAGVQLAEGGIVMPRPGGVQATIAEAGQAEAVIPLDRAGEFGLGGGGGVQITVYGGLLGDESSAREFAIAVDRELLRLRQNNESVSFDTRVV